MVSPVVQHTFTNADIGKSFAGCLDINEYDITSICELNNPTVCGKAVDLLRSLELSCLEPSLNPKCLALTDDMQAVNVSTDDTVEKPVSFADKCSSFCSVPVAQMDIVFFAADSGIFCDLQSPGLFTEIRCAPPVPTVEVTDCVVTNRDPVGLRLDVDHDASSATVTSYDPFGNITAVATPHLNGFLIASPDYCPTGVCSFDLQTLSLAVDNFSLGSIQVNDGAIGLPVNDLPGTIDSGGNISIPQDDHTVTVVATVPGGRALASQLLSGDISGTVDEASGTMVLHLSIVESSPPSSSDITVQARFRNRPPRAAIAAPSVVGCSGHFGSVVNLSAAPTVDPDGVGDIAEYLWQVDGLQAMQSVPNLDPFLGLGSHQVALEVVDRAETAGDAQQTVTVLEIPPIANAGPMQTVECSTHAGGIVSLNGSSSYSSESSALTYTWFENCASIATGPTPTVVLPVGIHTIGLLVTDDCGGDAMATTQVIVVDTQPPIVTDFGLDGASCLWPPNHEYAVYDVGRDFVAQVVDACDPNPLLMVNSAGSSQPDNSSGDGNTANDVVQFSDHVCLRAERQGTDPAGRTYTVGLVGIDHTGNKSASSVASIAVPHDQGGNNKCQTPSTTQFVSDGDPLCTPSGATGPQDPPGIPAAVTSSSNDPFCGKDAPTLRDAAAGCQSTANSTWTVIVSFYIVVRMLRRRRGV